MEVREGGFVAILIGKFYFPIAAISIECPENRKSTKRVDKLVHAKYGIKVPNGYFVQLVVVQAKSKCSVFWVRT